MRKENKNKDFSLQFLLLCQNAGSCVSSMTQMCRGYFREHASKTDKEEKKLWNEVIVFVFFVHKNYSHSFINLRLNHWCHINYFNNDYYLTTFLNVVFALLSMQG